MNGIGGKAYSRESEKKLSRNIALLVTLGCVCLIAAGQIMFKLVANKSAASPDMPLIEHWLNWPFVAAMVIYALATVLWVWILRFIPLSVAYPVFAMAFIIVPIAAYFLFNEPLGMRNMIGGLLILAGVAIIAKG